MGVWDRIQAVLRREKRDLDEAVDGAEEIDAEFDAVRKRIEGD